MTQIKAHSVLIRTEDAVFKEDGEQAVVLDLKTGNFYKLDEVGVCFWQAIDGEHSVREIADEVVAQFETTKDHALPDLILLADEMRKEGLIKIAEKV